MECKFEAGQFVACIKAVAWRDMKEGTPMRGPTTGEVCKITAISAGQPLTIHDGRMVSVFLKLRGYDQNTGFAHVFFRPLKNRPTQTSIEAFKKLLNPTNHKVLEDA